MTSSFDKVSMTAKLAAYMRQFTDIPFAAEVAAFVQADAAYQGVLRDYGLKPEDITWYAPIFEVRYKSIAATLRTSGISQVLEIASGLSLRGLAMTEDPSLTYIETDLAPLTAEKAALAPLIVEAHGLEPRPNHHLIAANAVDADSLQEAAGILDPSRPIAVVNEGLFPYLSPLELRTVAANVRDLLRRFGGFWLTPDFSIRAEAEAVSEQRRRVRQAVNGATDREMYRAAFGSAAEMQDFFDELGLDAEASLQVDAAPKALSVDRLHLPPDTMDRLRPRLKLWTLRLAE
ncbi:MAG TPA: class I SAM-dependent methyltransferase [Armatimonadota bacterium]|jgi:O-methyltransferase involved in polyketide biosynthesis